MIFTYKNIAVNYTVSGKGRAVILLHGFLENLTIWKHIENALSKKYKVICIDLLGHGKTENLGYIHTMRMQTKMVKALLNHLRLRKYVLIGHSMGGYVALSFAYLFSKNIKGICLINAKAQADSKEKIKNRNRAIKAIKQNYKTFIKVAIPMLFSGENKTKFKKEINNITKEALKMTPQGITASLEGIKIRKDKTSVYKNATYPIQLFASKQDTILNFKSITSEVKDTKVKLITLNGGHMSIIENQEQLTHSLPTFLKRCF